MCTMSLVGDYYTKKWEPTPWIQPVIIPYAPQGPAYPNSTITYTPPSRQEFEALKAEVLEMKELLKAAKLIDEKTNQPDCETEDKVALLKKIADMVGVDLSEVFGK